MLGRQQNNIKGARTDPIDPLLGSMMPVMTSRTGWVVGEVSEGVGVLGRQQDNIDGVRTDPTDALLGSMTAKFLAAFTLVELPEKF